MAEVVSLEGPVEVVNGELAILIPLEAGGAVLAPLAKGIGEIDGEFLKVVIRPWLAEKLRIAAGSLVIVDNANAKFTITLSSPLVSTPEPFTHAHRPSIAFVGEQPVVAWSEERDAQLAGLFVARWNGSSWTRLGVLSVDRHENDSFLTPAVAVDVRQQIWLAWTGYGGGVRVARWNGGAWRDVGRESLEKVVAVQLDDKSKELVRTTAKDQLIQFYSDWGRGIRNGLGLWRGNDKLLESCGRGTKADPEACSMVIIEAVWTLLQPPAPGAPAR